MIATTEQMQALFRDFRRSAFRLETHQTYTMPAEQPDLDRFLSGEPKPEGHNSGWTTRVAANRSAGKTMQRVKVVRRPFTDYTRFLFAWAIPDNVAAGEDYRILDLTDKSLDVPDQDFWIFDDTTVALLNFDQEGTLRDRELADGPVEQYLTLRDLAIQESVPFIDYRS